MSFLHKHGGKNILEKKLMAFTLGIVCFFAGQQLWKTITACRNHYDLLNADFVCTGSKNFRSEWEYDPLRTTVAKLIADRESTGKVTHVSVYFRDLKNGARFSIGEYDSFYPASLLKVPVMVAILHEADRQPGLLDQKMSFTGSLTNIDNVEKADETIEPDVVYTVRELLAKMIEYSDNYSKHLLVVKLNTTPPPTVYNTFLDLGLTKIMSGKMDNVSIQSYSILFTILYNSWYLSDEMSQYALELLSQTTFKDGLVAGVPNNIRVAHKFGLRTLPNHESQLHDCGIVYHPTIPYVLCVMTSGSDVSEEAHSIADISSTIFDGVTALRL